jgi:hypothetical protein
VQVLAPNFPQTDSDIDAREYSFDDGENSTDFKGFHRLERLLFRCAALLHPPDTVLLQRNDCAGVKGFLQCLVDTVQCFDATSVDLSGPYHAGTMRWALRRWRMPKSWRNHSNR